MATEEVIGNPTMVIAERFLFIPESKEVPMEKVTREKELVANKQDIREMCIRDRV